VEGALEYVGGGWGPEKLKWLTTCALWI